MITPDNFGEISDAVAAAVRMRPDRPGVGRLCQELLAELSNRRVSDEPPASIFFPPSAQPIGAPGRNPWGRKGRPVEISHDH